MTVSLQPEAVADVRRGDLPPPGPRIRRFHRHPRLMHYHRLIAVVLAANAAVGWWGWRAGWWSSPQADLAAIALLAQLNLVVAVVPRQHYVINAVGWLATRPRAGWSQRLRWACGKYYHLGGVHVGAAVAGASWYVVYVVTAAVEVGRGAPQVNAADLVLPAVVVGIFAAMIVTALPRARTRRHDRFEAVHRLGAWSALGLVWINTLMVTVRQGATVSLPVALARTPTVWLLVLTSAFAAWPWVLLRRVPVRVERPSGHAAIVALDHDITTTIGTTRAISRHPLVGWHHFAVVPSAGGRRGYRMLVSRAGDWTGHFIDAPPTHVWVRGIPATGVANVRRLFSKVLFVVTGSGIGPALSHLLADEMPTRLLWVTRDPRSTYGESFVDEVLAAQPDAVVWNTDQLGKPDVLALAHRLHVESGSEAVICISNRTVTWSVVHGLEQRGIPAFGPIWDS
jgi:hypothetical protein